jgi:hypothetical protein
MGSKPSALQNLLCCVSIAFLCLLGASRSIGIVRVSNERNLSPFASTRSSAYASGQHVMFHSMRPF